MMADARNDKPVKLALRDPTFVKLYTATVTIPQGFYATPKDLLKEIHFRCNDAFEAMQAEANAVTITRRNEGYYLPINATLFDETVIAPMDARFVREWHKHAVIYYGLWMETNFNIVMTLHPMLRFQLGFSDYYESDPIPVKTGDPGKHPPLLSRSSPRSMWVFSNVAEPSFVADTTAPLLRFMPVDHTSHQISYESFGTLLYKPISMTSIRDIHVWLSESYTGEPIHFLADIVIRLTFDAQ